MKLSPWRVRARAHSNSPLPPNIHRPWTLSRALLCHSARANTKKHMPSLLLCPARMSGLLPSARVRLATPVQSRRTRSDGWHAGPLPTHATTTITITTPNTAPTVVGGAGGYGRGGWGLLRPESPSRRRPASPAPLRSRGRGPRPREAPRTAAFSRKKLTRSRTMTKVMQYCRPRERLGLRAAPRPRTRLSGVARSRREGRQRRRRRRRGGGRQSGRRSGCGSGCGGGCLRERETGEGTRDQEREWEGRREGRRKGRG